MEKLSDLSAIQNLFEAAQRMADDGTADKALTEAVRAIEGLICESKSATAVAAFEDANELHSAIITQDCDLDLDSIAYDNGSDGWWVMAWLHVPYREPEGRDEDSERPIICINANSAAHTNQSLSIVR